MSVLSCALYCVLYPFGFSEFCLFHSVLSVGPRFSLCVHEQ